MSTEERLADAERRVAALEAELRDLKARLDRWATNGLRVLDSGPLFPAAGGTNGTSALAARSDHT